LLIKLDPRPTFCNGFSVTQFFIQSIVGFSVAFLTASRSSSQRWFTVFGQSRF